MLRLAVFRLASVLVLGALMVPVVPAFATRRASTSIPSTTGTSSSPYGITGTDPEPIDPGIVTLILSLLPLA